LDSKTFKQEYKRVERAYAHSSSSPADTAILYTEFFEALTSYLKDCEGNETTNEDIGKTVGCDGVLDTIVDVALEYASFSTSILSVVNVFGLIYTLADILFDRAYYRAAWHLFNIAYQGFTNEQKVDCVLKLALLLEEVGDIYNAVKVLENAETSPRHATLQQKKCNSRLITTRVRIKLDNLLAEDDKKKKTNEDYLVELGHFTTEIKSALSQDDDNYEAFYVSGLIYEKTALHSALADVTSLHSKAIEEFNTAIEICIGNSDEETLFRGNCYIALGRAYDGKSDYGHALAQFQEAKRCFSSGASIYPVYTSVADDLIRQAEAKEQGFNEDQGFSVAAHKIMTCPEMAILEKRYYENKAVRKNFIRERHRIEAPYSPKFYILQRWNSFTPILSTDRIPSTLLSLIVV